MRSIANHDIILSELYEQSSNFFLLSMFFHLVYIMMELSLCVSILQIIQFIMKNIYLLYSIIDVSYTKALIVTNTHGTLYYASLGDKPEALIVIMKKDFTRLKNYVLQPIVGKTNSEVSETLEKFRLMAKDPRLINTMHKQIPYEFIFGTELQRKVWNQLMNTEALETVCYSQLASNLGIPKSSRVVGAACGANKIALFVPCHRALTKLGQISGYRWGVPLKQRLLKLEQKPSLEEPSFKKK